ncbi:hypothetical protein CBM2585_A160090 [Cupriavidus taiwanensis]|nr:hypothetical protein CBM2585_A160090 [Cupriavidus taiwanensis]SPC11619.1 hypothetical protein CT19431_40318 [Cupriavidus taiwanensis]
MRCGGRSLPPRKERPRLKELPVLRDYRWRSPSGIRRVGPWINLALALRHPCCKRAKRVDFPVPFLRAARLA